MTDSVSVPKELFDFLMGSGQIDGCWFGDRPITAKGDFWWRDRLRDCGATDTTNRAEPVAWGKTNLKANLARTGHDEVIAGRSKTGGYTLPLYAAPPSDTRERELVEALKWSLSELSEIGCGSNDPAEMRNMDCIAKAVARYQKEAK